MASIVVDPNPAEYGEKEVVQRIAGRITDHPIVSGSVAGTREVAAVTETILILATGTSINLWNVNCGGLPDSSTEQFVESAIDLVTGIDIPNFFPVGS